MNNSKTKLDDLDVYKLWTVAVDLKLSNVVAKEILKNNNVSKAKNIKVNNLESKIPDGSALIQTNQ